MQKLVWIDLETTGLDPAENRILEVAMVLTNADLEGQLAREYVIHFGEAVRSSMALHPKVVEMHTKNSLFEACENSTHSIRDIDVRLTSMVIEFCQGCEEKPILAGSSVHFDRSFIHRWMPLLDRFLHHRHFDVSVLHRAAEMFSPDLRFPKDKDEEPAHRAMADIQHSIAVAKHYRDNVFGQVEAAKKSCEACSIEAEIGTEDDPHPIPARFHKCKPL